MQLFLFLKERVKMFGWSSTHLVTSPNPPKALVKALNRLKKRDDIVITKPDKGSGVVVMDKPEYIRLLSAASVDNTSKFTHVDDKRPKMRGRPPKHFHKKETMMIVAQ